MWYMAKIKDLNGGRKPAPEKEADKVGDTGDVALLRDRQSATRIQTIFRAGKAPWEEADPIDHHTPLPHTRERVALEWPSEGEFVSPEDKAADDLVKAKTALDIMGHVL